jgi:transposase-like protein
MTMTENASDQALPGDVEQLAEQLMDRAEADQAQLLGPDGLLTQLTQRVLNRALDVELAEHLGYEKGDPAGRGTGNNRNGATTKTVLTDIGAVPVTVPRDRNGSFEQKMVPKHARRLAGFNEQILSLYARGMSVRDIRAHLADLYGVQVSPDLISKVTDAVTEEITAWQNRPLDPVWPILYIDPLHRCAVGEDPRRCRGRRKA